MVKSVKKIEKSGKRAVRDRLLYCEALESQLLEKKKNLKTEKENSIFSQMLSGKVIKKYRMMKNTSGIVSCYLQKKHLKSERLILGKNKVINKE